MELGTIFTHSTLASETEDNVGPSGAAREMKDKSSVVVSEGVDTQTRRSRLGLLGYVVMAGGSMVAIMLMAFFVFLWTGEGSGAGKNASSAWRWIVLNERLAEAITLATLLLRVVMTAQTSICTSLLAAILLEKHGVPVSRAAEISLQRSSNDGALRLTWLLLTSRLRSAVMLKMITFFLFLNYLAVQFSSTILVSDLGYSSLVEFPFNITMGVSMTQRAIDRTGLTFPAQEPVLTPFGEVSTGVDVRPSEMGVSDTGLVRRLFPPITAKNITAVHSYSGGAIAMDSQYVCAPPALSRLRASMANEVSWLTGQILFQESLELAGLGWSDNCDEEGSCIATEADFNCSLPYILPNVGNPGLLNSVCLPLKQLGLSLAGSHDVDGEPSSNYSTVFLVYRTNSTRDNWGRSADANSSTQWQRPLSSSVSGEWVNYVLDSGFFVEASLCFQKLEYLSADVVLSSDHDLAVPTLTWMPDTFEWDTAGLENQFGTLNYHATAQERGLFVVDKLANAKHSNTARCFTQMLFTEVDSRPAPNNATFFLSPYAQGTVVLVTDNRFSAVFKNTIEHTNRPVLALQSFITALTGAALGGVLAMFDDTHEVTLQYSASVLAPRRVRGLVTVIAVVAAGLAINFAVVLLYLSSTQYSIRGSYWSAVAQVASDETRHILDVASRKSDDEVGVLLARSQDEAEVRIGLSADGSRVTLVRSSSGSRSAAEPLIYRNQRGESL